MEEKMQKSASGYLVFSGAVTFIGGLVHISMIFGGPTWYRFFGAPEAIVQMAATASLYPVFVCLFIAAVLFVWSSYAFSGAGIIPRLPGLRMILITIAIVLIIRGISFIPLILYSPAIFKRITSSQSADAFLIITSAICLLTGLTYAIGIKNTWPNLSGSG